MCQKLNKKQMVIPPLEILDITGRNWRKYNNAARDIFDRIDKNLKSVSRLKLLYR